MTNMAYVATDEKSRFEKSNISMRSNSSMVNQSGISKIINDKAPELIGNIYSKGTEYI
jgi:hypothetical protein